MKRDRAENVAALPFPGWCIKEDGKVRGYFEPGWKDRHYAVAAVMAYLKGNGCLEELKEIWEKEDVPENEDVIKLGAIYDAVERHGKDCIKCRDDWNANSDNWALQMDGDDDGFYENQKKVAQFQLELVQHGYCASVFEAFPKNLLMDNHSAHVDQTDTRLKASEQDYCFFARYIFEGRVRTHASGKGHDWDELCDLVK